MPRVGQDLGASSTTHPTSPKVPLRQDPPPNAPSQSWVFVWATARAWPQLPRLSCCFPWSITSWLSGSPAFRGLPRPPPSLPRHFPLSFSRLYHQHLLRPMCKHQRPTPPSPSVRAQTRHSLTQAPTMEAALLPLPPRTATLTCTSSQERTTAIQGFPPREVRLAGARALPLLPRQGVGGGERKRTEYIRPVVPKHFQRAASLAYWATGHGSPLGYNPIHCTGQQGSLQGFCGWCPRGATAHTLRTTELSRCVKLTREGSNNSGAFKNQPTGQLHLKPGFPPKRDGQCWLLPSARAYQKQKRVDVGFG